MKSLTIRWESCVRTRARAATCRACVDVCPSEALDLSGPRDSVAAQLSRCIECGLCQAVCPTEAISSDFEPAAFLASAGSRVRCGEGVPCVAALSAEDLVTLAIRRGQVNLTPLASCAAAKGHAVLESRIAEVNTFLAALGGAQRVSLSSLSPGEESEETQEPARAEAPAVPARRAFFGRLLPQVQPAKSEEPSAAPPSPPLVLDSASLDIKSLRTTSVPRRRLRLFDAIAVEAPRPAAAPAPKPIATAAIGFTSSKALDVEACTACMLCVNACPTGALSSSVLRQELHFEPSRCVKCATCHDVCEPHAISLAPTLDTAGFVARSTKKALGRFRVTSCGECGMLFKREGDAVLCPRCLALEEEARELMGMR